MPYALKKALDFSYGMRVLRCINMLWYFRKGQKKIGSEIETEEGKAVQIERENSLFSLYLEL